MEKVQTQINGQTWTIYLLTRRQWKREKLPAERGDGATASTKRYTCGVICRKNRCLTRWCTN